MPSIQPQPNRDSAQSGAARRPISPATTGPNLPRLARPFRSADQRGSLPGVTAGTFGRLLAQRPRYLLHGVAAIAVVGIVGTIALQPHQPASLTEPSINLTNDVAAAPAPQQDDATLAVDSSGVMPADSGTPDAAAASATDAPAAPQPTAVPTPTTYQIADGDTLAAIAQRFNVSTDTILDANDIADPDLLQPGDTLTILPTDGILYTLQAGDTLVSVANRFGILVQDILAANDLGGHPDLVPQGTKLVLPGAHPLPPPQTVQSTDPGQQAASIGEGVSLPAADVHHAPSMRDYQVEDGDTLVSIADRFGVDVATILSNNGIDDPDSIVPGSQLSILPVKGISYAVQPGETLADIAWKYQVDLGLLLDYNDLTDPDRITSGQDLVVPGGRLRADLLTAPKPILAPVAPVAVAPAPAVAAKPAAKPAAAAPAPAPAPAPKPAAAPVAVVSSGGGGGADIVATAMKYQGYRYVFGGTSPAGFDCSGFVYYVQHVSGHAVGRGMWEQFNGGPHIAKGDLEPGDIVFFSNTYEPGLSHDGIYIGGGQFIHAADENTGVVVSSLYTSYWISHYTGATRLW